MLTRTNNTLFDVLFDDRNNTNETFTPASDIYETDSTYDVNLALAGFKKKDITLKIEDNSLIISGERKKDESKKYNLRQSAYGKFRKVYTLPEDINSDKITAKMEDGILHIEIPKDQLKLKKRLIDIN
jgi:HSP20 family protein